MPELDVIPLAEAESSEGHAFLVRHSGNDALLLDAGSSRRERPEWVAQTTANDIWISHGHIDHVGALEHLLADDPTHRVVLPAKAVARAVAIAESAGLPASRAHAIFDNARRPKFHEPFRIGVFDAVCGPSGHGSGAGVIRLTSPDGATLAYTGDWCLHDRPGIDSVDLTLLSDVDLLVAEAALAGTTRLDDWSFDTTWDDLHSFLDTDGPRLLAVSPFAELDDVAALLGQRDDVVFEQGLQPHIDPKYATASPADAVRALNDGRIVVAAGSSLSASTPAGALAVPHVTGPRVKIALFNSVPANSEAAILLSAERRSRRRIYGETRRIRATIRRFDFPTHATRPNLVTTLVDLAPRKLLLFHASADALHTLRRELTQNGFEGEISIAPNDSR